MKKVNAKEVKSSPIDGTKGVDFRQLIAKEMRPPNFYMRLFTISPGGSTPRHSHSWEHEVFIVEGSGSVLIEDKATKLSAGDAVFIEPNETHQFVNDSDSVLRLVCIIPKPEGD